MHHYWKTFLSSSISNPAIWIYPLLLQENVDPPFLSFFKNYRTPTAQTKECKTPREDYA